MSRHSGVPPGSQHPDTLRLSIKTLTSNCSLLNGLSTGCDISLESSHLSEKNLIEGNFSNGLQNMCDCLEKCFAITEFVSCQELLDVAEEIRDRNQKVADQMNTVD
jgi:hypothetical protein